VAFLNVCVRFLKAVVAAELSQRHGSCREHHLVKVFDSETQCKHLSMLEITRYGNPFIQLGSHILHKYIDGFAVNNFLLHVTKKRHNALPFNELEGWFGFLREDCHDFYGPYLCKHSFKLLHESHRVIVGHLADVKLQDRHVEKDKRYLLFFLLSHILFYS